MPNGPFRTEVRVGIGMKIITMTTLEVEVETETVAGPTQGEEQSLCPDLTPGLALIAIESGVIDVGNTTILHLSTLIPQLMRRLTMKKQIQPLYK